jgi:hypothetical protein
MPKLTNEERDAIVAEVEETMLAGRWSRKTCGALAKQYELSTRTLRAYHRRIEDGWKADHRLTDTGNERAFWLARVRLAEDAALRTGNLRALSSLLATEARVLGLEVSRVELRTESYNRASDPVSRLSDEQVKALANKYLEEQGAERARQPAARGALA